MKPISTFMIVSMAKLGYSFFFEYVADILYYETLRHFFLQMKHEQTNVLHDVKSSRHRRCIFESLKTGYDKRYGFNIIVQWIF